MNKTSPPPKDPDATSLRQFIEWGNEQLPATDWVDTLLLVNQFLGLASEQPPMELYTEDQYLIELPPITRGVH
jgi:hypothetical protein